jgi:hypothetical protein
VGDIGVQVHVVNELARIEVDKMELELERRELELKRQELVAKQRFGQTVIMDIDENDEIPNDSDTVEVGSLDRTAFRERPHSSDLNVANVKLDSPIPLAGFAPKISTRFQAHLDRLRP